MSSFESLPRRGDDTAPLNNSPIAQASAQAIEPAPRHNGL
jgi:hypothetical protein